MQIKDAADAAAFVELLRAYIRWAKTFTVRVSDVFVFNNLEEKDQKDIFIEVEDYAGISYEKVKEIEGWDLRTMIEQASSFNQIPDDLLEQFRKTWRGRH